MREWLARAVRAPRDPAWTADGYVSERWAPFSPVTGRLGAFEWKTPVERLGRTIEQQPDVAPVETPAKAVAPVPIAPPPAPEPAVDEAVIVETKAAPKTEAPATALQEEKAVATEAKPAAAPPSNTAKVEPKVAPAFVETTNGREAVASSRKLPAGDGDLPPPPDDPGVDPDEAEGEGSRRFRLF